MWLVPALVAMALLLAILACGLRAVIHDLRARRWVWAALGTVATLTGLGALALVLTHASLTAQIGL